VRARRWWVSTLLVLQARRGSPLFEPSSWPGPLRTRSHRCRRTRDQGVVLGSTHGRRCRPPGSPDLGRACRVAAPGVAPSLVPTSGVSLLPWSWVPKPGPVSRTPPSVPRTTGPSPARRPCAPGSPSWSPAPVPPTGPSSRRSARCGGAGWRVRARSCCRSLPGSEDRAGRRVRAVHADEDWNRGVAVVCILVCTGRESDPPHPDHTLGPATRTVTHIKMGDQRASPIHREEPHDV
jgi:hypothetical protein